MGLRRSFAARRVALSAVLFFFRPDRRLASESFPRFAREGMALLGRRDVLIALALFLAPCGSFALTDLIGGVRNDFHASERFVSSPAASADSPPASWPACSSPCSPAESRCAYARSGIAGSFALDACLGLIAYIAFAFVLPRLSGSAFHPTRTKL